MKPIIGVRDLNWLQMYKCVEDLANLVVSMEKT